jgi:hypothetical protein
MLVMLVLLQASALEDRLRFDLRNYRSLRPNCSSSANRDIVVCAREVEPQDRVQVGELPPDPMLPRMEFNIAGGAKIMMESEHFGVGGFVSNREMARLKIPF